MSAVVMGVAAAARAGIGAWASGSARGAAERAGRTANQERVIAGKKQVRQAWRNLVWENEQDRESLRIIKSNTKKYLDREDEINTQNWWLNVLDDRDRYDGEVEAYNKSVEGLETALNFNQISSNIALEEENNYMDDFFTSMRYDILETLNKTDDSITAAEYEANKAQINIQTAMNRGASDREMLKLQNKAERANSAYESQQERIKGMQAKGKLLATGVAGRSARKALQAIDSGVGMQQSMRIDALLNKNSMYKNQLQASYDNLYYQKAGFKSSMDNIQSNVNKVMRDFNLSREQAEDTLQSGLKANETRMAKIAAAKYSADLAAKSQVLSIPKPPRFDPPPFKAIRPEYQEIPELTDEDKQDFYDQHMPTLSDENKIYGDSGGRPSGWQSALNIGLSGIQGYMGAGGDFNAQTP